MNFSSKEIISKKLSYDEFHNNTSPCLFYINSKLASVIQNRNAIIKQSINVADVIPYRTKGVSYDITIADKNDEVLIETTIKNNWLMLNMNPFFKSTDVVIIKVQRETKNGPRTPQQSQRS